MARALLFMGALIFFALGVYHGILTLRDLSLPRAFTPTDEGVRRAMQESRLALNPRVNLWEAWIGFNLSHSLGVVLFGGGLITIAWLHFPVFARSPSMQVAALAVAAAYLILSLRFWFWVPAIGVGIGLACFLASIFLLYTA
jgi:hypothetical protein